MTLTRRNWLQLALAGASAGQLTVAWSRAPDWRDDPFALGVASGFPSDQGVVLWTRLVAQELQARQPPEVTVYWELAQDEQFQQVVQQGQAQAVPELAHSVHVELRGLAPDRWYYYRFQAGRARSPTGRTRTLPAPGTAVRQWRLAYASCQRWEHGYFAAHRHLSADAPDVVLFLGDYIYEYPGARDAVRSTDGRWLLTLQDYRARYALYKSDADLQASHAACPWFLTWDDHEVQNDYAGQEPGQAGPVLDREAFLARRAAAYQAYYEHMPLPAAMLRPGWQEPGGELRLYGSHRVGGLLQINLLDTRQYRDRQVCTPGGQAGASMVQPDDCPDWRDPRRSLLGRQQERWLEQTLGQRSGQWQILAQQTLMGSRRQMRSGLEQRWNDGWDGYPAARQRLLQGLQQNRVSNAVVLGGDVHENWVGLLRPPQPTGHAAVAVEFCGTSISSRAGQTTNKASGDERVARLLALNPDLLFGEVTHRGYGLVDVSPTQLTTTLRVLDDATRPDARVSTLARFVVEPGRVAVHRV